MQHPTADLSPSDTRVSSPSVVRGAVRRMIDCGGALDSSDANAQSRYDDRADVRRAMDARRGMYADQVQAI